jgi:3-hydroxyisobutyrate dehydrogenase-like beta-hydroxyacid dehydrogenase
VSPTPAKTVAVAGLGNLGEAIARRLVDRGWTVAVLDRNQPRVDALTDQGAQQVDAAGLAASANIVFVVPDDTAVRAILDDGLQEALGSGHTVLVISTVLPESARELAELIEGTGAAYIDLPVSGGAQRARDGSLALFVGASQEAAEQARDLLDDLGEKRFRLGPAGTASATKLAHQLILFATLGGTYEALRLTGAYGIDDSAVLEAVSAGLADSWVVRNWGFYDRLSDDYDDADVAPDDRPWSKDLREAVLTAADAGVDAPIAGLLAGILPRTIAEHASATRTTNTEGALR